MDALGQRVLAAFDAMLALLSHPAADVHLRSNLQRVRARRNGSSALQ